MTIEVTAAELDSKPLKYTWETTLGRIEGTGNEVIFHAPQTLPSTSFNTVSVEVSNGEESTTKNITFNIEKLQNPAALALINSDASDEGISALNEREAIALALDPKEHEIRSVKLDITYDPLKIEAIDAENDMAGIQVIASELFDTIQTNQITRISGDPLHHIIFEGRFKNPPQKPLNVITIPFKTKATTVGTVFDITKIEMTNARNEVQSIPTSSSNFTLEITNQEPTLRPAAQDDSTEEIVQEFNEDLIKTQVAPIKPEQVQAQTSNPDLSETGPKTNILIFLTIGIVAIRIIKKAINS